MPTFLRANPHPHRKMNIIFEWPPMTLWLNDVRYDSFFIIHFWEFAACEVEVTISPCLHFRPRCVSIFIMHFQPMLLSLWSAGAFCVHIYQAEMVEASRAERCNQHIREYTDNFAKRIHSRQVELYAAYQFSSFTIFSYNGVWDHLVRESYFGHLFY